MRRRIAWLYCLVFLTAAVVVSRESHSIVAGQTPSVVAKDTRTVFRTPDGQPDLQGVWTFATVTPLQRPPELADKEFFTAQEAAEVERQLEARRSANRDTVPQNSDPGVVNRQNEFWYEGERGSKVVKTLRTSVITDPRDGRLPPLTPEAERRRTIREAALKDGSGPENFSLSDRCILSINAGPPMITSPYNNNVQVFQSRDHVVIYNEMIHNARIVPLDGRPQLDAAIRQYLGDSRGRWDGDTLVIETANFAVERISHGGTALTGLMWDSALRRAGTDKDLRLTERFSRMDADTLLYEFTVNDPKTWTQPWSGALTMSKRNERVYEYACHEGNYAMTNSLTILRAAEKAAAAAKSNR